MRMRLWYAWKPWKPAQCAKVIAEIHVYMNSPEAPDSWEHLGAIYSVSQELCLLLNLKHAVSL